MIYNEYPFSDAFKGRSTAILHMYVTPALRAHSAHDLLDFTGVQQCELPDGRPLRCLFTSLRSDIRRAKAFLRHSMVSVGPTWTDVFVRELRAWRELVGDHATRPSLVYMRYGGVLLRKASSSSSSSSSHQQHC